MSRYSLIHPGLIYPILAVRVVIDILSSQGRKIHYCIFTPRALVYVTLWCDKVARYIMPLEGPTLQFDWWQIRR
jgi:hypothetical protein